MDPLRLVEIVQDGFQTQKQRAQQRDHPWKSPIERYRNKQLANDADDEDGELEELSWKHRSKAYDITRSDVTNNRVYHTEEENYNHAKFFRYTDQRPKSIVTDSAPKMLDEQVVTPATIPMDDDEFDSPYSDTTPTRVSMFDSSPSVVTPPKAILDQLAMDHKQNSESESAEGTEVTLQMFRDDMFFQGVRESIQKENSPKNLDGVVQEILERRSGVKELIAEHERLMAETQSTLAVTPESFAKSKSRIFGKNKSNEERNSPPKIEGDASNDKGYLCGEKVADAPVRETNALTKEECGTEANVNTFNSEQPAIVVDDGDEDERYLPRSSILTTIVEESTPLKVSSPMTISPERHQNDSKSSDTRNKFRALQVVTVTPDKTKEVHQVRYTRKAFREMRRIELNKVTIAASLIEFNNILMEETSAFNVGKMTNDSRLFKAIMKHRKENGFFTGATPTHESLKNGAATIIQAFWRTVLAIRYARRKVDVARNFAASLIQAQWRAHDDRMTYRWYRGSAILLQAKWKSFALRKQYNLLRYAAVQVQSVARMNHFRDRFLQQKSSAIFVQTKLRTHYCQKQYHALRSSAIAVQSISRMYQCQKRYFEQKKSAILMQTKWRSYICRRRYKEIRCSTVKIQSMSRMHRGRAQYLKWKSSSRILQSNWRSFVCQKQYHTMRSLSITLQAMARMKLCRNRYILYKNSARIVQTKWRSFYFRNKYDSKRSASILIQSMARMQKCRAIFLNLKASSTSIQATWRMLLCRKEYLECKNAATTLQSSQRMNIYRSKYIQTKKAATTLQSFSRMHSSRASYLKQKHASTILQASSRMFLCRRQYHRCVRSAIMMQTESRAFFSRSKYLKQRSAAIAIQGVVRMHISRGNYLLVQSAAFVLQVALREYMRKKDGATFAAIREVQEQWRSSGSRSDYMALMKIKDIPTSHRISTCKINFMHYLSSSIIQKSWRNYIQRKNFQAARSVQARWRAHKCRKSFLATLYSARLLQSRYRTYIRMRNHRLATKSATAIQSIWRSCVCEKQYRHSLAAAITLQARFRAYASRKEFVILVSKRYNASATIQAAARMHLCRTQLILRRKAVTRIQAVFRSYACRKEIELIFTNIPLNGEGSDIDENDEGTFLGRSSILTTIVEERSPLTFASPPLGLARMLSDHYEDESEEETLPTTIKKEKPDVIHEENTNEVDYQSQKPVKSQTDRDLALPSKKSTEAESRRASEERLKALVAKVAAKRRASLNGKRLESTSRDPWQRQIELQKKSKPVLLSKRMGELEKLAGQKRVSSSIWNTREEQNIQRVGDTNNGAIARYPNVFGDRGTNENNEIDPSDSVVKKLFESDGFNDLILNANDTSNPISENGLAVRQGVHGIGEVQSEINVNDGNEDEVDSAPNVIKGNDDSFDHPTGIENQSFEMDSNEDNAIFIDESEFGSCDEREPMIRAWKRQSIVDDLADDIYGDSFESDSDNESVFPDQREQNSAGDVSDLERVLVDEIEGVGRPARVWSVVDDLIDDDNESFDSEGDGDFEESSDVRKNGMSSHSPVSLSKIRKDHPLWNISGENVSESISASFYTVAGIAASLIGMGE